MEQEILSFIKKIRVRYFLFELLKKGLFISSIGIGVGAIINFISCIFPIYKAIRLSSIIAFLITSIGIIFFSLFYFPSRKKWHFSLTKQVYRSDLQLH